MPFRLVAAFNLVLVAFIYVGSVRVDQQPRQSSDLAAMSLAR